MEPSPGDRSFRLKRVLDLVEGGVEHAPSFGILDPKTPSRTFHMGSGNQVAAPSQSTELFRPPSCTMTPFSTIGHCSLGGGRGTAHLLFRRPMANGTFCGPDGALVFDLSQAALDDRCFVRGLLLPAPYGVCLLGLACCGVRAFCRALLKVCCTQAVRLHFSLFGFPVDKCHYLH